ncbi:YkgJ family cysteine cluster protein [archaeon]|nr:MAG: YkgJ family cysteine cluster protein [archaeon]RLG64582.1 MAG: YkgJ family cysteine cluster protein [archaeon]
MELTEEDIRRIEKLGFKREGFTVTHADGRVTLKNVNGHCIFLDESTGKCTIYPHRPIGCRLYPIIYDEASGDVTVDPECPAAYTVSRKELEKARSKVLKLIKTIEREALARLRIHP